ncbi:uncharacterized protein A1O9_08790 [Exophiala aquamarina CBS 119918]|uniref:DUF1754-domain-containing protein n=1 Tax=Exophiala aquamarina CBS 119918 TaxID=1182545 RepID=A0A072P5Y9_9EURO|nr:uncharacterized protein A1O9_08790 [Exophiala aquamarina CBS 119918]KEF55137.1 hypothetical protein A1O9_08790 [Exophiala aquamarina CBS 119918]
MAPGDYASVGTGKLKLKGVKDSKVDKKKKKKKSKLEPEPELDGNVDDDNERFQDRSVMLQNLRAEDALIAKEKRKGRLGDWNDDDDDGGGGDDDDAAAGPGQKEGHGHGHHRDDEAREAVKTDAERRYEEQRRKRLEERLKREGVKTHKERVEELNRYLSSLSEHHDMPRIGPG